MKKNILLITLLTLVITPSCRQGTTYSEYSNLNSGNLKGALDDNDYRVLAWDINELLRNPLQLAISEDFSIEEEEKIISAANKWDDALTNTDLFSIKTGVKNKNAQDLGAYYDSEMGVYKSYDWFASISSTALAVTQFIYAVENFNTINEKIKMLHADIIFNYRDFLFSTNSDLSENDFYSNTYNLYSVVIHELGHYVGMGHTTAYGGSVMYPYVDIYTRYSSLSSADIETLQEKYQNKNIKINKNIKTGEDINQQRFTKRENWKEYTKKPNTKVFVGILESYADHSQKFSTNQLFINN